MRTKINLKRFPSFEAGLPDGLFSNQKYQFWKILEGVAMEDVGIF
jgi:hypothetical protein